MSSIRMYDPTPLSGQHQHIISMLDFSSSLIEKSSYTKLWRYGIHLINQNTSNWIVMRKLECLAHCANHQKWLLFLIGYVLIFIVWTTSLANIYKAKAQATWNDDSRYGKAVTLVETYFIFVHQIAHWLTWALPLALNLVCLECNFRNTLARATTPIDLIYMKMDDQFYGWWTKELKSTHLLLEYVLPIKKSLQDNA